MCFSDVYCQQLQTIMKKLVAKQPSLANSHCCLKITRDNCTTDGNQIRRSSIGMSKTSTVLPEIYFNRLPFFFEIWITSCKEKKSTPMGQSKQPSKILLIPVWMVFFSTGVNELPMRWQKCIDNNGLYFDKINKLY